MEERVSLEPAPVPRAIVVEVLDRHGGVRFRHRIDRFPATLGRGFDNDVILDDPHVSARHARIEATAGGRLVLVDAGSENGLRLVRRERADRIELDGLDRPVTLGRTALRFRGMDDPVAPTIPVGSIPRPVEWIATHPASVLLSGAAVIGLELALAWRETLEELAWLSAFGDSAGLLVAMALWAGGWALATRMLAQRGRFVAQWTVIAAFVLGAGLFEEAMRWVRFASPAIEPARALEPLGTSTLFGIAVLCHLTVAGVGPAARRGLAGALVGTALLGFLLLDEYDDSIDWVSVLPYWSRIQPVDPAWLPLESADEFFAGAAVLRSELDREADEELERRAEARRARGGDDAGPP